MTTYKNCITFAHVHSWMLCLLSFLCVVLYDIYRMDNKPLTLMLPVNTSVQDVMSAVVKPGGDHILVKMNSMGGGSQILNILMSLNLHAYLFAGKWQWG